MFNWQNQMRGGMPQMGQQGPPMGGQQGPPPGGMPPMGGQQGPPQPRPGPAQPGPGMGGGAAMPAAPSPGQQFGMARSPGGGSNRGSLQSNIDHYMRQLQMAQINGAPPQVIASLQMQLQQAQRAYQEAGMREMAELQRNRPQPGAPRPSSGGGGGGGPSPYYGQQMNDWNAQMQLLMGLYGMGGGPRGIGG